MSTCSLCGRDGPEGEFCGYCGAHLATGSARRFQAFAADPGQHVLQPNIVSTLFPHLPHRHSTHVRIALLLILLLLAVLGVLRLTGSAIAVAAVGVPFLYLLYLYEVQAYGEEPWKVVGFTFGFGLLFGIPWALLTGPIVTRALLSNAASGPSLGTLVVAGVLLPVGAQMLMLVGPAILFVRGRHREPLDGFAFGVACALGFSLATTVVELWPELRGTTVSAATPLANSLTIVGRGLLVPFLNASTTGLIAGALWLRRLPLRSRALDWTTSLQAAIVGGLLIRVVISLSEITVPHLALVVAIYLVISAIVLLAVRYALHAMLLAEEKESTIGPPVVCANCRAEAPLMPFCPSCGIARQATPRFARRADDPHQAARPGEGRRWAGLAGAVLVAGLILSLIAVERTPSIGRACGVLCAPPPPPCLKGCSRAMLTGVPGGHVYRSSAYGYSVEYPDFSPSREDDRSIGWDLSSGSGQYSIDVVAGDARGRTAGQVVDDIVSNNFADYGHVYDVPGAEVGYSGGAGAVYDGEVTPFFGLATENRLVVLAAVNRGLAIAVVGVGDAAQSQGGHPDPSGLPVSGFIDSLANGTSWPQ